MALLVGLDDGLVLLTLSGEAGLRVAGRERVLDGPSVVALAACRSDGFALAGTHDDGLWVCRERGHRWRPAHLPHRRVMSVAIADCADGGAPTMYAGTEPSHLYRSTDGGRRWEEIDSLQRLRTRDEWSFPPRPWTHHVRTIAVHPEEPRTLYCGIELGGLMRSDDGGSTWHERPEGAPIDVHVLLTHPAQPDAVWEAAGDGVGFSEDRGRQFEQPHAGLDLPYVWASAVDGADGSVWYVAASVGPRQAHLDDEHSHAAIYRRNGSDKWILAGGEGQPVHADMAAMPYAMCGLAGRSGVVIAGLRDGRLVGSHDSGDTWHVLAELDSGVNALCEV